MENPFDPMGHMDRWAKTLHIEKIHNCLTENHLEMNDYMKE